MELQQPHVLVMQSFDFQNSKDSKKIAEKLYLVTQGS